MRVNNFVKGRAQKSNNVFRQYGNNSRAIEAVLPIDAKIISNKGILFYSSNCSSLFRRISSNTFLAAIAHSLYPLVAIFSNCFSSFWQG